MLHLITKLFPPKATVQQPVAKPTVSPAFRAPEPSLTPQVAVPIYPPTDAGIAIVRPQDLMHSQAETIGRIKVSAAGLGDVYTKLLIPSVERFAAFVQLLPATQAGNHSGAGGLFRLGLETGFSALQAAQGSVFSTRAPVEQRRAHEDRWQVAAFISGLCAEAFRPATDLVVRSPSGEAWPIYKRSLYDWATAQNLTHVHVTWHAKPVSEEGTRRLVNALLLQHIVTPELMTWLDLPGTPIVPAMLATTTGIPAFESAALARVVHNVHKQIVSRDAALQPTNYGRLQTGGHLEPHLLDGMRRLVREGRWLVNQSQGSNKPRLWYTKEGLFLVWSTAAKELIESLRGEGVSGVPSEPLTLVEILARSKIVALDNNMLFSSLKLPSGKELEVVRIAEPDMLMFGLDSPAPAADVVVRAQAPQAAPKSTAPQLALGLGPETQKPYPQSKPDTPVEVPTDPTPQPQEPASQARGRRPKKGEVPPIKTDATPLDLGSSLDALLEELPRSAQGFMRVVVEDWQDNKSAKLIVRERDTYMLSDTCFTKYALRDGSTVSRELSDAGWLQLGAQGQRFVTRKIGDLETECLVLNAATSERIDALFAQVASTPIEVADENEGY